MRKRVWCAIAAAVVGSTLSVGVRAYVTYARWPSSTVDFYINPDNMDVSADAAEAALRAAAEAWTVQSGAHIRFTYAGRVNDTTTGYDLRNVVIFRNATKDNALASTYSWTSNGVMIDSDIIFWDAAYKFYGGSSGCESSGAYIQDVATHEFGHALGLHHSDLKDATMYPGYGYCSQNMRSLASDDIAGVRDLYPPTSSNTAPSVSVASPTGGASYSAGAAITFAGSAQDAEDGEISARLSWRSNIDGTLGTGGSFSRTLSSGSHVVTVMVTDSGGLSSSKQVSLSVAAANTAPTVNISAPANNSSVVEGTAVTFSGSASDAEEGNISARLVWSSSRDGQIGTGASVSKVLSTGTHTIVASVSDSSGSSGSKQISIGVTAVVNAAPSVTITAPANGTAVAQGTAMTFSGTASDPENGNLTARIVWTSSLDGPMGMGGSISKSLSVGTHTVTASVTDGGGLSASKQISVSVASVSQPTPAITLAAKGYKVRGSAFVDLSWSGAGSSGVDIYRDGVRMTSTTNSGAYTDKLPKKGGGTSTYKVCEAGTATCSNAATAVF